MLISHTNNLTLLAGAAILATGLASCSPTEVSDAAAPTPAVELSPLEVKVARAMSAAPSDISAAATIVDADGTVLRAGTNGWTCFPGVPLIPNDEHPMCNDATWMAWLEAAKTGGTFATNVVGVSYMLQGDAMVHNMDPAATTPDHDPMWVQEGPHVMMLFPSTDMIAGLPRDPHAGGPYVMWDNTPMVHVMVPIESKAE